MVYYFPCKNSMLRLHLFQQMLYKNLDLPLRPYVPEKEKIQESFCPIYMDLNMRPCQKGMKSLPLNQLVLAMQIYIWLHKTSKERKHKMKHKMAQLSPSLMTICMFLSLLQLLLRASSQSLPPCSNSGRQALLQFKDNFIIDNHTFDFSYPKTQMWELQGDDCCSWDGVECDRTGCVIGLDLSMSGLYGSLDSNSSLFQLVHLQKLNLALNNFNFSPIPRQLGNFSRLVYLNLSQSFFSGRIPSEISKLSRLSALDLSYNYDYFKTGEVLLELERPGSFGDLIQNFTNLEYLRFSAVKIESGFPHILANFTKLKHLKLSYCQFQGQFPESVFQLPNLQVLLLFMNPSLSGNLPEFHSFKPLQELDVGSTLFSGKIPASFGMLNSLEMLSLDHCNFYGEIPPSLLNLTNLASFTARNNSLSGKAPAFLSNATKLQVLKLGKNKFNAGEIPPSFAGMIQLQVLDLSSNSFRGQFPSWITNLTQLTDLELDSNALQGRIPSSISRLKNLEIFYAHNNQLSGVVELDKFLELKQLNELGLSGNSLSVVTNNDTASNISDVPRFKELHLGSCNLTKFPAFLQVQDKLEALDLSFNNIHGEVPRHFCNWRSLQMLDLSRNSLIGDILECLANSSKSLKILNLQGNNFHGPIPQRWTSGNTISFISLGQNKLQGTVPRSLIECKNLEVLDLGGNELTDSFPSWLGNLPVLKILILSSNNFHGEIANPGNNSTFPKLRVIDLSSNNFSGDIPETYFNSLVAMEVEDYSEHLKYLEASDHWTSGTSSTSFFYNTYLYSITLVNKGIRIDYQKILEAFAGIDLSCNRFHGEIPESVGRLSGLLLLNLSNNYLSGEIPSSLANLTKIEALDLSHNKLTGEIPLQLERLNSLAVFNVSENRLTGPIPRGQQFETFTNSSFFGNPGLCGGLLMRRCNGVDDGNAGPPDVVYVRDGGEVVAWEGVVVGSAIGFFLGLLFAHMFLRKVGLRNLLLWFI